MNHDNVIPMDPERDAYARMQEGIDASLRAAWDRQEREEQIKAERAKELAERLVELAATVPASNDATNAT